MYEDCDGGEDDADEFGEREEWVAESRNICSKSAADEHDADSCDRDGVVAVVVMSVVFLTSLVR